MQLTPQEAIELLRDNEEDGLTVASLEKKYGFTIGGANVAASAPAPVVEVPKDPELVAHVEALIAAGRRAKATKAGRPKTILGDQENLGGYRVIITAPVK